MKNCNCHTEINTDGSGQLQRYLKALDPAYAPVDNRSIADLLVFAKRYAAQIRFYDLPGTTTTSNSDEQAKISWREFFRRDMAVVIASIATTDTNVFKKEFNEVRDKLEYEADADLFAALFNPIVGMLKKIDRWYSIVIPENPVHNDLALAIGSDLRTQAMKILAYKKQFNVVDPGNPLKIDLDDVVNKELWGLNEPVSGGNTLYEGDTMEEQIRFAALNVEDIFYSFYNFLSKLVYDSAKYLDYAMNKYPGHQPHMALFITFLELFRIVQQQMNGLTERMLDFYYRQVLRLVEKPSIPDKAHIVFELAKDVAEYHLEPGSALSAGNDLSGKEQLYKTEYDFVINQAKVAELKTIFVEKDFLYGKQVKEEDEQVIKSIYARPVANSQDGFGEKFTEPNPKWYTFGAGNPDIDNPKNICEEIEIIKKVAARKDDQAKIGFAIASPQLLMEGGKRLVHIIFNPSTYTIIKKIKSKNPTDPFEIWFTGEKKWFKVDRQMSAAEVTEFTRFLDRIGVFNPNASVDQQEGGAYYFDDNKNSLCIYLPVSEQGVTRYDAKIHKDFNYSTALPVMQIRLNANIDLTAADYKSLSVSNLALRVKVGSVKNRISTPTDVETELLRKYHRDGLSKLVIQTENGLQEPGKPFDPYSPYPARGKFFYVGSEEVFNKPFNLTDPTHSNDRMAITIKRTDDNDSLFDPEVPENTGSTGGTGGAVILASVIGQLPDPYRVDVLNKREWKRLAPTPRRDFTQILLTHNILLKRTVIDVDDPATISGTSLLRLPIQQVNEWKPGTEKGFLRITNTIQPGETMEDRQKAAIKFEIAELYVSYDSTLQSLDDTVDEFYHLYPFGTVQVYAQSRGSRQAQRIGPGGQVTLKDKYLSIIPEKEEDPLVVDARTCLLPQFTYEGPYDKYNTVGKTETAVRYSSTVMKMEEIEVVSGRRKLRRDRITDALMRNASSFINKLQGGANQYSALAQEEGMLQIGIEKLKPLQTISLLFQFAEGSAEDEDKQTPDIHWSYLTNNEWRPLKAEYIVADGTFGFQTTGIVKISLPEDATDHNTICTDGLQWLCASVTRDSDRIPQLINVVAQATEVIFDDQQNDQSHFEKALPAGTINKLVLAVPEVSKVIQPFASFDGKHKEIGKEFYTRVSERLRHKRRAITPWDYEHLVLDRFPSIYKVKCIKHTDPDCLCRDQLPKDLRREFRLVYNAHGNFDEVSQNRINTIIGELKSFESLTAIIASYNFDGNAAKATEMKNKLSAMIAAGGVDSGRISGNVVQGGALRTIDVKIEGEMENKGDVVTCCGPQIAPGHVLLVPIANLKNRNAVNPLQPKTARRTLLDIEAYLKKITSPFVHVHAKNPVYEQVLVFFRVKFYPQYEVGYFLKKLNDEIVHFLTPWAFDENAEVKFGQKIYASSIINFIEERNYVDFITDFNMVVCKDECCPEAKHPGKYADDGDIVAIVRLQSVGGGGTTGVIKKKAGDSPIEGIAVRHSGDTTNVVMTDADGKFAFGEDVQHGGSFIFSVEGYKSATADEKFDQDIEIVFRKDDQDEEEMAKKIEQLCGCSSVENLFQDEMDLPGDIVAKPSTARSILVSAPQHLIIPYKEPPYLTPCEKKALAKGKTEPALKMVGPAEPMDILKPEPAADESKKKADTKNIKKTQPGKKSPGKKPNK